MSTLCLAIFSACEIAFPPYDEHTHVFVDGECECGEPDPDFEESAPHTCVWSEWTIVLNETCTTSGLEMRICEIDSSHSEQRFISPKHILVDHEAQAPTCIENGWNAYQACSRCNYTTYKEIFSNGHSFANGICENCPELDPDYQGNKGLQYTLSSRNTYYTVSIGSCTDTNIVIPRNHNNLPVTHIADNAFNSCSSLKSISIPDSISYIGDSAFAGCSSLTNVTIPNSVTYIGESAFSSCDSLTSITISESITSIYYRVFYGCSRLTNIIIPNNVTYIASCAFENCSRLTTIIIPNGVTSIASYAFSGCSSLTNVTIPDSVTYIGGSAFEYCYGLTSITIPNGVTSIAPYAFSNCISLTSLTIPENVTSIDYCAFYNCTNLTSIIIPNSVTSIGSHAFNNCKNLTSIIFEDTNTWYRTNSSTDWNNKTGGVETDVMSPFDTATYFNSTYDDYYWYKL
ncbi:MAG: leucine-rich repeat domain-containing protein [Clostridia bacterium]|nr:leucine-rich repeat domain-containing protein [Clostridia bacterium]